MNRIFCSLLFALLPRVVLAQFTGPGATADTAKQLNPEGKKPVFTLQTLRMAPLYIFEINDNAKIDATHQFPGMRPLSDSFHFAGEQHLTNIRQLTFEGKNTRPEVDPADTHIVFQSQGIKPNSCDQLYRLPIATGVPAGRISSGKGRASGAAFINGNEILFSSTESANEGACPPEPKEGFWPLDRSSTFYTADSNGKLLTPVNNGPTDFDGDAAVSPNGVNVLFTSTRTGEAELYTMSPDGSHLAPLTHESGFAGEGAYAPDGKRIAFVESHLTGRELTEYKRDILKGYFNPKGTEIYVMNADGSGLHAITHLGGVCASPCWTPDGAHIIFSSNHLDPKGHAYDLFMINADGTGLERITHGGGFNGFPTFTHDGKQLLFCSSRHATHPGDINIFVADWTQQP